MTDLKQLLRKQREGRATAKQPELPVPKPKLPEPLMEKKVNAPDPETTLKTPSSPPSEAFPSSIDARKQADPDGIFDGISGITNLLQTPVAAPVPPSAPTSQPDSIDDLASLGIHDSEIRPANVSPPEPPKKRVVVEQDTLDSIQTELAEIKKSLTNLVAKSTLDAKLEDLSTALDLEILEKTQSAVSRDQMKSMSEQLSVKLKSLEEKLNAKSSLSEADVDTKVSALKKEISELKNLLGALATKEQLDKKEEEIVAAVQALMSEQAAALPSKQDLASLARKVTELQAETEILQKRPSVSEEEVAKMVDDGATAVAKLMDEDLNERLGPLSSQVESFKSELAAVRQEISSQISQAIQPIREAVNKLSLAVQGDGTEKNVGILAELKNVNDIFDILMDALQKMAGPGLEAVGAVRDRRIEDTKKLLVRFLMQEDCQARIEAMKQSGYGAETMQTLLKQFAEQPVLVAEALAATQGLTLEQINNPQADPRILQIKEWIEKSSGPAVLKNIKIILGGVA